MSRRILVVLGLAVGLLAVYTLVLEGGRWPLDSRRAAERLRYSATQATDAAGTADPAEPAAAPAAESTKAPAQPAAWDPNAVRPSESWGTDPYVRDWVMVNELAELNLKAITIGGERAYVLINDQILEEGDQISNKRIVLIEPDKVTLEQGGRTFTLFLGE